MAEIFKSIPKSFLFLILLFFTCGLPGCGGNAGGAGTVNTSTAPATYTVLYNGNGNTDGTPPTDPNSYQQGQTVTVLGNTGAIIRPGYVLSGWNTQEDGNGITYMPGQTFLMGNSSINLYAKWVGDPL